MKVAIHVTGCKEPKVKNTEHDFESEVALIKDENKNRGNLRVL